ncbi:hypothetical protein BB558_002443 [Smittium angustum]|uniref:RNA polymerase II-associated protein 1 N-terminal domain-containing protein n=1 Tax=Smittium angustum TaxID=133377 RepID=A0A2U1J8P3_SMIAN|nr:hypothetical protein BB558_002443 [Smittium angustum]
MNNNPDIKMIRKIGDLNTTRNEGTEREVWRKRDNVNVEVSEDELLKMQQEFMQDTKIKPAASIIKRKNAKDSVTNVENDVDQDKNYTLASQTSSDLDSTVENMPPAAQLIVNQMPPEIFIDKKAHEMGKNGITKDIFKSGRYSLTKKGSSKKHVETENLAIESDTVENIDLDTIESFKSENVTEKNTDMNSRSNNNDNLSKPGKKLSLFAQKRLIEKNLRNEKGTNTVNTLKTEKSKGLESKKNVESKGQTIRFDKLNIVENEISNKDQQKAKLYPGGFPKVYKKETPPSITINTNINNGKKDEISRISLINEKFDREYSPENIKKSSTDHKSDVISVQKEKKVVTFNDTISIEEYERENDEKLGKMTIEQVESAQQEIMAMLEPANITFLLNRKKKEKKNIISNGTELVSNEQPINSILLETNTENAGKNKLNEIDMKKERKSISKIQNTSNFSKINQEHQSGDIYTNITKQLATDKATLPELDDNDTEFYKKLKKVYFENEVPEVDKLKWITSFAKAKSPSERVLENIKAQSDRAARVVRDIVTGKSASLMDDPTAHLRFDFEGTIVDVLDDIPTHKGLHHHGDDPDNAGYTIPEILHLMRSTVAGQRVIAIKLMGRILYNLNVGKYNKTDSLAIYMCWLDWEGELYFVPLLKDSHLTVKLEAIKACWTWIVGMMQYNTITQLAVQADSEDMAMNGTGKKNELVDCSYLALRHFLEGFIKESPEIFIEIQSNLYSDSIKNLVSDIIICLKNYSEEFSEIIRKEKQFTNSFKQIYGDILETKLE